MVQVTFHRGSVPQMGISGPGVEIQAQVVDKWGSPLETRLPLDGL
jgi:hypothetical protein